MFAGGGGGDAGGDAGRRLGGEVHAAAQARELAAGFGGVAEYGITVRWNKNFLKVIRLLLERRAQFSIFGGVRFGGTLTCLCSRIPLEDNSAAILVVSTERAGKDLSLPERARRLLADIEKPAAIFSADGELIEATPAARKRLGPNRDLIALGAEAPAD